MTTSYDGGAWPTEYACRRYALKNETNTDLLLGPEFFRALPEGYTLPRIVIPPLAKHPVTRSLSADPTD